MEYRVLDRELQKAGVPYDVTAFPVMRSPHTQPILNFQASPSSVLFLRRILGGAQFRRSRIDEGCLRKINAGGV